MEINQLKNYLKKGIVQSVLVTPFNDKGEVDYDAYRTLVSFINEYTKNKQFIITPGGTTSEGYSLTDDEWRKIVEITLEETSSFRPVIPGLIEQGIQRAVSKARLAAELGASGVMLVLPSYIVPNEQGLYKFYSEVAKRIDIGIVVYNNPDVSKIYMKPHILNELVEKHPNIIGVKENTPSISMLYSQLKRNGDLISIWQGRGEWWYTVTFHLGPKGFASGLSNFAPQLSSELLEAGLNKDLERIEKLRDRLWYLESFFSKMEAKYGPTTTILPPPYTSSYVSISVIKASMNLLGLKGGRVRIPLIELSDDDLKELESILLEKVGLNKY